ncbi:MAG TPA: TetR/AcrR family transcriptional regulator [Deltaproteobacteria bacterium]|nr:TetR/AcrR family transcriptional regulator [Deltaproteobacteria bacterium]
MPRIQRTQEEVDAVKEGILQQAVRLMNEVGYQDFSMRMLAREIRVSAPTLYSYFQSKDDLYLCILTEGFSRLYEIMLAAYNDSKDPVERLAAVAGAYVDFGLASTNFYNLMFTWHVPKYNDYVGTTLEPVARLELDTALQVVNLSLGNIKECAGGGYILREKDAGFILVFIWSTLHGYIAGLNNTLLSYMHKAPGSVKDELQAFLHETLVREIRSRRVKKTGGTPSGRRTR